MKLENEEHNNAFFCAINGIKSAIKTERNLKFDIFVAIVIIACGFLFRICLFEWLICILSIGVMLFAELMNTAIEAVVDLYTREKNRQAGIAKDISAGAVLVLSVNVAVVGIIIFVPKVYNIIIK